MLSMARLTDLTRCQVRMTKGRQSRPPTSDTDAIDFKHARLSCESRRCVNRFRMTLDPIDPGIARCWRGYAPGVA